MIDRLRAGGLHGAMTTTQPVPTSAPRTGPAPRTAPGTVLVTGGTGTTGRRVAAGLRALGATVRTASRSGQPRFAWEEPATWDAALDGAAAAYVCYSPDLAVPGAADVVAAFAARARAAGVRRLVLLSGRGEEGAERAEEAVRAAFPAAAVVRSSWFAQNLSESFLLADVLSGVVAVPVADVTEPFVDVRDVADVAVAALTADGHAGLVQEVTGPDLLTLREAVAAVAAASGRDVRFERTTPAEHRAGLLAAGVPEEVADLLGHLFTEVLDGRGSTTTGTVERVLGRPARRFADYVRETAATGAWNPA